jgi:hypothetical protein
MVGVSVLIFLQVQEIADADLTNIAQALNPLGRGFGPG